MNILELCYEYPPIGGGGARVVEGLSLELARLGHQLDLITMGFRSLPNLERHDQFTIHRIACLRKKIEICHPHEMASYLLNAYPHALALIKQKKPEINHTHFIFPDGILAYWLKKKTGLPYLLTSHGSDVPGYNPDRFKILHVLLRPMWKAVVGEAFEITTASVKQANLIKKQHVHKRVVIIPNGHNSSPIMSHKDSSSRILVVSRLLERKGVQYLIEALRDLAEPVWVDVVGDGPYRDQLASLAATLPSRHKFNFHGWVDQGNLEFRNFFEKAGIFIFPSEAENFPMVLLEAMDSGLAIITTDDTGCAEVVGDSAILVPPQDSQAIQGALLSLLKDPSQRQTLGQKARQRLQQNYNWTGIAAGYVAEYQKAVRDRSV